MRGIGLLGMLLLATYLAVGAGAYGVLVDPVLHWNDARLYGLMAGWPLLLAALTALFIFGVWALMMLVAGVMIVIIAFAEWVGNTWRRRRRA